MREGQKRIRENRRFNGSGSLMLSDGQRFPATYNITEYQEYLEFSDSPDVKGLLSYRGTVWSEGLSAAFQKVETTIVFEDGRTLDIMIKNYNIMEQFASVLGNGRVEDAR